MKPLLKWFLRAVKGVLMVFGLIYLLSLLQVGMSTLMHRQESAQVDTTAPTLMHRQESAQVDTTAPTLSSLLITSPSGGNYLSGQVITATATFSDDVRGATLSLPFLVNGTPTAPQTCTGGEGEDVPQNIFTCTYTTTSTAGPITIAANALQLATGTMEGSTGNALPSLNHAAVTLPSINAAPIDCTKTGNLIPSNIGKLCTDESIYAGQSDSYYLFTTRSGCGYEYARSGCGYEYAGTSSTAPTTNFTPTCTGSADSMTKQYSSASGTEEGATSTTDGLTNTNTLVETMPSLFNPAAAYCYYLNLHGQTDWYLPSKDELDVLYTNRRAIGGFYRYWWWWGYSSSSEIDDQTAWILNVNDKLNPNSFIKDDDQHDHFKSTPGHVRCVRRLK
jgi:hypothetical protein